MKKWFITVLSLLLLTSILVCSLAEGKDIPINSKTFPDKAFRKVIQQNCDTNGDNIVSVVEQKGSTSVSAESCGVSSAKGIELFQYATILDLGWNSLEKLDLSGNPKLEYVGLSHNKLTSLNLSNSTHLIDLSAESNRLTSLDLSACPKLEVLYVPDNKLKSIDVSSNQALEQLVISGSGMKMDYLDLTHNPMLERLDTHGNNIRTINISGCSKLIKLAKKGKIYQDESTVGWYGDTEIIIDKNTTLVAANGEAFYQPDMFPFLPYLGDYLFPEAEADLGMAYSAVITKETKVYSDKKRKHAIGTIPAYTVIKATTVKNSSSCEITGYGDLDGYVAASALWRKEIPSTKWFYRTLPSSIKGYQRPDYNSASLTIKKGTHIAVIETRGDWSLIRAVGDNGLNAYYYIPY